MMKQQTIQLVNQLNSTLNFKTFLRSTSAKTLDGLDHLLSDIAKNMDTNPNLPIKDLMNRTMSKNSS